MMMVAASKVRPLGCSTTFAHFTFPFFNYGPVGSCKKLSPPLLTRHEVDTRVQAKVGTWIELRGYTKNVLPFLTRMCTKPLPTTLCDEPLAVVMKALSVLRVGVYSTKCSRSVKMCSVAPESRIRDSL